LTPNRPAERGGGERRVGDDLERALATAAWPTRRRIEHDLDASPPAIRPLLRHVARHLYEPGYGVADLRATLPAHRRCQLLRNFRSVLGMAAKSYLTAGRLETACHLLCRTDLSATEIGFLVGYTETPTFTQTFRDWFSMTPHQFRVGVGPEIEDAHLTFRFWIAQKRGRLGARERLRLLSRFQERYRHHPEIRAAAEARRALLEAVAEVLRDSPFEKARELLRHEIRCHTPELFHLLWKKAAEAGKTDPRHGAHLARLALVGLDANRKRLGNPLPRLPPQTV